VSDERYYCSHPGCYNRAVCSTFSWDQKTKEGKLLGHWCEDHDTWRKRFQLPKVPRAIRNHILAFLTLASAITLAIMSFETFMIAAVAAASIYVVCLGYVLLLEFFDEF
jgi:hypothetical protein